MDDMDLVKRALDRLPAVAPPPGLEARLLRNFDARPRHRNLWIRAFELVWPEAPVWAPASAFATALLLGITLGAVLPGLGDTGGTRFSLEQPSDFSLVPSDLEENL